MKLLRADEVLGRGPDFSFAAIGGRHYFIRSEGHRVQTDKVGKIIWESLPGRAEEVIRKSRSRLSAGGDSAAGEGRRVDSLFLEEYSYVLFKAGIIRSDSARATIPASDKDHGAVSAIVITHNGADFLSFCFGSLIGQSYRNLEIIAVDNLSTDGTPRRIREDFPNVRVHALPRNLHFAAAVNIGIARAKGRYVFILNQDVEVEKECVARLVARAKSEPGAAAVVPMMKFRRLPGFINGLGNQIRRYGWGSDNFIGVVDVGQFANLGEVPSACFGAALLDRAAVDEVGPLDERYKAFYEDVDWSFRAWMKGWRIAPEPGALVYHEFGASYQTCEKLCFVVRNRLRLVLKLFRKRYLVDFIKSYFIEDAKGALSLLLRKKWGMASAYAVAYGSLVGAIPEIFLTRLALKKRYRGGLMERDILAKNPAFFSALNEENVPVVDADLVAGYYHRALAEVAGDVQKERRQ